MAEVISWGDHIDNFYVAHDLSILAVVSDIIEIGQCL